MFTRATIESLIIARCGNLIAAAELDGLTADGTNVALNEPIGWSLRQIGGVVADVTSVANSDLVQVGAAQLDHLLDLAVYRVVCNALDNYDAVDLKVGERDEKWSQLGTRLEKAAARLLTQITRDYGFASNTLTAGVITLDFEEPSVGFGL